MEMQIKNKHHRIIQRMFLGWYWVMFKWIVLTVPALIVKIFAPKEKKLTSEQKSMCVCQSCGNHWEA